MKYKVGDIVTIRQDLKLHKEYGNDSVAKNMLNFTGKKATITKIYPDRDYKIDIDDNTWYWTDQMFVDKTKSKTKKKKACQTCKNKI